MAATGDAGGLSPVPRPPVAVPLPFDLSWDDLRACLPGLRHPVGAFRTHEIRGLHQRGRSQVLTVRDLAADGRTRDHTVFVKLTEPDRPEAPKYRSLAARQAPVATLLGSPTTAAGEVLVLAFLPVIGTTPEQADDLLDLVAHLNSTDIRGSEVFRPLPGRDDFVDQLRGALSGLTPDADRVDRWLAGYRHAAGLVSRGPRTLNHNELGFQQVGWTSPASGDGPGRLVAVDLETMALLPRHTDVAGLLPALSTQTGRTERDLFATYLAALRRRTGRGEDHDQEWRWMLVTRIVRGFEALPWLCTAPGASGVESPVQALERIERDLRATGLGPTGG